MKQSQQFLIGAAVKSFFFGAVICLVFYTVIRLMFWDFPFSFSEEAGNLFKIVTRGGLMFSIAAVSFLLIEKIILRFSGANTPVIKMREKRMAA